MKLNLIIAQLRTYCPAFAAVAPALPRVAGAAEFKMVPETVALPVPCAYVIPLEDSPEAPKSLNAVRQQMVESFAVVVALGNTADERGQASATALHDVRKELWKALLGWKPEADYDGIAYEGGSLLQIDRARLWYRFEFGAPMEIGPSDGWEEGMLAALPKLQTVHVNVDVIEPIAQPSPGPDGRIEFQVRATNLNP